MKLRSLFRELQLLPDAEFSEYPKRQLEQLVRAHVQQFPFLAKHPDFVQFLGEYGGGYVGDPESAVPSGFAFTTLFGVGEPDLGGVGDVQFCLRRHRVESRRRLRRDASVLGETGGLPPVLRQFW